MAWAALFGAALATLGTALMPDKLIISHPCVENPFGVLGVIGGGLTTYDLFGASRFLGLTLLIMSSLAALISPILRLHRTRGNEHQQIKWFLFGALPLTVFLGLIERVLLVLNLTYDFYLSVAVIALLFVLIFTYIAILRYRLYDIDVIVNRTLVYGSLTAMLALLYFGGVTLLQDLFRALTGQEKQPQLVIVASTPVIAALFNPLRRFFQ